MFIYHESHDLLSLSMVETKMTQTWILPSGTSPPVGESREAQNMGGGSDKRPETDAKHPTNLGCPGKLPGKGGIYAGPGEQDKTGDLKMEVLVGQGLRMEKYRVKKLSLARGWRNGRL